MGSSGSWLTRLGYPGGDDSAGRKAQALTAS